MRKRAADWRRYAAALASYLRDQELCDSGWIDAFARLPRHEFLGKTAGFEGAKRAELLRTAYADRVIVTRESVVDGHPEATSSLSQPAIMAVMLQLLAVDGGERVLEIGTGAGYNAGLLCVRLGDHNVTSVDIDPELVDEARDHLSRLGYHPYLRGADGEAGCAERAPFDRVIATCALTRIPPAWLGQLAPGARVVAPMTFGGALAVLDRAGDGSITGRFARERGFFMDMRHEEADVSEYVPQGPPKRRRTRCDPGVLADWEFRMWLELTMPHVHIRGLSADGTAAVELSSEDGRAQISHLDDVPVVSESGKPLWSNLESAHAAWVDHGRPGLDRLGMTVAPQRQWVWLDSPESGVSWSR